MEPSSSGGFLSSCLLPLDGVDIEALVFILPLVLAFNIALLYAGEMLVGEMRSKSLCCFRQDNVAVVHANDDVAGLPMYKASAFVAPLHYKYIRTCLACLLVCYSAITNSAIVLVNCVDVEGDRVLYMYPRTSCNTDNRTYVGWLALSVLSFLIVVVCVPICVLYITTRSDLQRRVLALASLGVKHWSGILTECFVPGMKSYECLNLFRRVLYVAVANGLTDKPQVLIAYVWGARMSIVNIVGV